VIDVLDLVTYLHREGKITAFRDRAKDIQITCPYTHYRYDEATGRTYPYKERRPSLGISVEPPYFYNCFSCGAKGTVEFLVADILGISPLEAFRWLSRRYEYDEDDRRKISTKKIPDYEELFPKERRLKEYPDSYFDAFRTIHPYTLERGFTKEIAIKYEIGFDKIQQRVVFPIRNENGRIVGLIGRSIDPENPVKYLVYNWNYETGEIEGFDRGQVIYRNKAEERKPAVLVVESGLDVAWADQNGLCELVDVVAILGSKATETQAKKLSRYEEVISGLDNDFAGEQGRDRLMTLLYGQVKFSVITYPEGKKDLGDCTKEEMIDLVQNRKLMIKQRTSRLRKIIE